MGGWYRDFQLEIMGSTLENPDGLMSKMLRFFLPTWMVFKCFLQLLGNGANFTCWWVSGSQMRKDEHFSCVVWSIMWSWCCWYCCDANAVVVVVVVVEDVDDVAYAINPVSPLPTLNPGTFKRNIILRASKRGPCAAKHQPVIQRRFLDKNYDENFNKIIETQ